MSISPTSSLALRSIPVAPRPRPFPPPQATQACLDLEQQLRERQAAAQAATEAKAEAESALHAKLCVGRAGAWRQLRRVACRHCGSRSCSGRAQASCCAPAPASWPGRCPPPAACCLTPFLSSSAQNHLRPLSSLPPALTPFCSEAIRRLNEENGAFVASYHAELQQLAAVQQRLRHAAEFAEEQRSKQGQLAATAAQLRAEQQELEEGAAQVGGWARKGDQARSARAGGACCGCPGSRCRCPDDASGRDSQAATA